MWDISKRLWVIPTMLIMLACSACSLTARNSGTATPSPTARTSPTPVTTITPPPNPNNIPTIPTGSPAITPTLSGTPSFAVADAQTYLQQHPLMPGARSEGPFTVESVAFMSSRAVSGLLNGESTGYPDATLLCIAFVRGTFAFPAPPGASAVYQQGYLIFDATSGNLVINGGLRLATGRAQSFTRILPPLRAIAQTLTMPAIHPDSYTCSQDHCYAVAQWSSQSLSSFLDGLGAEISFTPMNGGDGFLDNELWLVQKNNAACIDLLNNIGPQCWVETGMLADATRGFPTVPHYFWADNRPNAGFAFHDLGPVSAVAQNPQTPDGFFITNDGPNTWQIGIVGLQTNSALFFAYSTNNPFVPNVGEFGQELYGANGAHSATFANYTDLLYYSGEFGLYINVPADRTFSDGPPFFTWLTLPQNSQFGGDFHTQCC